MWFVADRSSIEWVRAPALSPPNSHAADLVEGQVTEPGNQLFVQLVLPLSTVCCLHGSVFYLISKHEPGVREEKSSGKVGERGSVPGAGDLLHVSLGIS
jgi:hypothetical protein